jgi:predicted dithiol-disulfide oxidoreductase (DUF899 family)
MTQTTVSKEDWIAARRALLVKEKELTRHRDAIAVERRALPRIRVEKEYVFDTPTGEQTLANLFRGRSQLIVKHFMLAPGQIEGCVGCSFEADHVDGVLRHLERHDVAYVAVARAPLVEIEAYKARMGWRFHWVSSHGSDFNYDFDVSYTPDQLANSDAFYNFETIVSPLEDLSGHTVFEKDGDGAIYQTYSTFGRGAEEVLGTYMFLDMTPKGRNETGSAGNLTDWVRPHDRYDTPGKTDMTGRWREEPSAPCCHAPAAS